MQISSLIAKLTLGCAAAGLLSLATAHRAVAAPGDHDPRSTPGGSRAEFDDGQILGLQMSDELRPRDLFIRPGEENARRNRAARDSRRAARRGGAGEVDLAATVPSGFGELSASVSPIPEPSSFLLFAAGAGLVALIARRKLV